MLGIMSGTSMDAVDIAAVRLTGSGESMGVEIIGWVEVPFDLELRACLSETISCGSATLKDLTLLQTRLSIAFEEAIREALPTMGLTLSDIDVIGVHGQTIFHHPEPAHIAGREVTGTLQLGDPSILANLVGRPVVGDFRPSDMAVGGQGAPLVPYFDYVFFRHAREGRLLLNLGGIANVTVVPAGCGLGDVTAFDIGPANMVIDELARRLFDMPFDRDGRIAEAGRVDSGLLDYLLDDEYYHRSPPKSTGREKYTSAFIESLIERARKVGLSDHDTIATASMLTVQTVVDAWRRFVAPQTEIQRVIASGGGVRNAFLMKELHEGFGAVCVETTADHGVAPEAKEAICFAVLAHETLNGVCSSVPSATGASKPTILGKICLPG